MMNIASRPAGFLSKSTGGAARCPNGFNDGAAFTRTAEWVSVFPSDESTAAGPSGSSELGLYAGGGVLLSTPSTPRSAYGEASRSPCAELSARSAFACTPDQAPCSHGTQAPQHGKAKPASRTFLRKGSRMARSQPPASAGRTPGGAQPKRLQLQPRDAFKQAAVLVAERSSMQAAPMQARSSQGSAGPPAESALRTPRRSSGRRVCSLTPDGKSLAAGHSSCLAATACMSVEVDDADSCRSVSGRCLGPPWEEPHAHNVSADAPEDSRCEADRQLQALDSHLEQFQRENEALQRLQEQTELAERELALEREEIRSEMEVERKALRSEVIAEREALQQARRQFNADLEQQRLTAASERLKFRQRTDRMQEELDAKQKQWQRKVDRLQQDVKELSRTNRSLEDQLLRANQLALEGPTTLGKESRGPSVRRWAFSPARRMQAPLCSDARRSTGSKAVASKANPMAYLATSTKVEDVPESPEPPVQMLHRQQPHRQAQWYPAADALSSRDHSAEVPEALAAKVPGPPEAPPLPAFVPPLRRVHPEAQLAAAETWPHWHEAGASEGEPLAGHTPGTSMGGGCCSAASADCAAGGSWQGHESLRAGARFASHHSAAEAAAAEAEAGEEPAELLRESHTSEGRIEQLFADGRREVLFPNGLRKVVRPDGQASVLFQNGDVKETLPDGSVRYHYSTTRTVQTTHPDGTNVYCFATGQIERHYTDGSKEISFPNGTAKTVASDGSEDVRFADGTRRFVPR
mmetsp:Transcript_77258/g.226573  ORF Transcript_77258/g.226573 Transcript_77258/m.226573 type:complete len:752 (+) Transcript_77258:69-2324(+)